MSDDQSPVSSRTRSQDIQSTPRMVEDVEGGASYLGDIGEESRLTTPRTVESVSLSPFGGSGREKDAHYLRLGKECGLKGAELANYVLESLNKELRMDVEQREADARAKSEAAMIREQTKIMKVEAERKAKMEEEELKLKKEEMERKAKAEERRAKVEEEELKLKKEEAEKRALAEEKKAEAEERRAEAEERRAQAEERKAQAEEDKLTLMREAEEKKEAAREGKLKLIGEAKQKKETAKEEKLKLLREAEQVKIRLMREAEERKETAREEKLKKMKEAEEEKLKKMKEAEEERLQLLRDAEEEKIRLMRETGERQKEKDREEAIDRQIQIDIQQQRIVQEREKAEAEAADRERQMEMQQEYLSDQATSHVSIEPLKDGDDVDHYLEHFECVAKLCNWKENSWTSRLLALLTGKTRDAVLRIMPKDSKDYPKMKKAILEYFRLDANAYRKKFRSMRRDVSETFDQFLERLKSCFSLWCVAADKDEDDAEDVKDLIFQEQMYNTFTPEYTSEIQRLNLKSVEEVAKEATSIHKAKRIAQEQRYEQSRSATQWTRENRTQGYTPRDRTPPGFSNIPSPKQSGPTSTPVTGMKTTWVSGDRRPGASMVCVRCKQRGHWAKQCPNLPARIQFISGPQQQFDTMTTPALCVSCAKKPYTPRCIVRVNDVPADGLRDTGASQTVVAEKFVPLDCYTGRVQRVVLAESKCTYSLPIAVMELKTPFFTGKVEVLVMKNPVEDVLIGNFIRRYGEDQDERVPVYAAGTEECENDATCQAAVLTRAQAKAQKEPPPPLSLKDQILAVDRDKLIKLQKEDTTLAAAREGAERGIVYQPRGNRVEYKYKEGVLMRVFTGVGGQTSQICIPKTLRSSILALGHDIPMAGHLGSGKTKNRIFPHFYWPGMSGDIGRYVRSCPKCQRTVDRGRVRPVPLVKMPLAQEPFERVGVDIVGPITPMSETGCRYILVMVDFATRYPEAIPLRAVTTETVAEALMTMWSRTGIPTKVLTDRGTQFTSEMMEQTFRLLSIKGLRTTPYHAQCNGLVERFNGTLKKMLRKMSMDKPREWDRWIPALLFAYREVPQESTGYSPFEMLYGRRVRGPMGVLRDLWVKPHLIDDTTTVEYVFDLRNKIAETCKMARENLGKAGTKYKKHFDVKARPRTFTPGSRVLVLRPTKHNKLELAWQGPFTVEARIGEADYRIRMRGKDKLFHANMLKQFIERDGDGPVRSTIATVILQEEEICEVVPTITKEIPIVPLSATETTDDIKIGTQDPVFQKQLKDLACEYKDVFTDLPGHTNLEVCHIKTENQTPIRSKPYPIPYTQRESVREEIKSMLELGAIEPSVSPYCSPIVMVKKKDGGVRFCVDFRKLNKIVEFDAEPIPEIDYLFAKLGERRVFSKLDLTKGYWQIPMAEEDRPKTAFSTPEGHFQWKMMPFGLCTSGAVFTRMMRKLLQPLESNEVDNFIDDILVSSVDTSTHLKVMRRILQRLRETGLTAKPSKCELGCSEVSYLGHRIGSGIIKPEEDKMEKIRKAPRPTTKRQVRSFLGLVGFYRRFIAGFSDIALPLTDLTKGNRSQNVKWTEECDAAFQKLKDNFCTPPVCRLPVAGKRFVLHTDASGTGLGAVLCQKHDNEDHPVMCASKKLSRAEQNYSTIEKECLALVWAVQKFEPYLYGTEFTIKTDHSPLRYLEKVKSPSGRVTRWALVLQPFKFVIEAIPGRENVMADFLSRHSDA